MYRKQMPPDRHNQKTHIAPISLRCSTTDKIPSHSIPDTHASCHIYQFDRSTHAYVHRITIPSREIGQKTRPPIIETQIEPSGKEERVQHTPVRSRKLLTLGTKIIRKYIPCHSTRDMGKYPSDVGPNPNFACKNHYIFRDQCRDDVDGWK